MMRLTLAATRASKADPIFRGSKHRDGDAIKCYLRASKADPIFRGSKLDQKLQIRVHLDPPFQSRPDLQGVKTNAP